MPLSTADRGRCGAELTDSLATIQCSASRLRSSFHTVVPSQFPGPRRAADPWSSYALLHHGGAIVVGDDPDANVKLQELGEDSHMLTAAEVLHLCESYPRQHKR